jgi:CRISPR-associated protein Cas5t
MTPSAAWGLVLNLAAIETRSSLDTVVTGVRDGVPRLQLAIGTMTDPAVAVLYQQLHTYPVGSSGKELAPRAHGSKYWIAPVRREVLLGLDSVVGVRGPPDILERVQRGLRGELQGERYGLPFAGDNNFFFERLDVVPEAPPARWWTPVNLGGSPRRGSTRLTIAIDRDDSSRTRAALYAPTLEQSAVPPDDAWTWVPRPPDA